MLGKEILVTPITDEKVTTIKPYFPKAGWHEIITGLKI